MFCLDHRVFAASDNWNGGHDEGFDGCNPGDPDGDRFGARQGDLGEDPTNEGPRGRGGLGAVAWAMTLTCKCRILDGLSTGSRRILDWTSMDLWRIQELLLTDSQRTLGGHSTDL